MKTFLFSLGLLYFDKGGEKMPAIMVDKCSTLKEILTRLGDLPPCNWLVSELICYDYCGWPGCEKWAEETLFLTDSELRRDVCLRDMQMVWGAFSAIPREVSREAAYAHSLPWLDGNSHYMHNHILPQHPLALLEIASMDSSYVVVSARDSSLLQPLYNLPYPVRDEEAFNRKLNEQLRRIQTVLRKAMPDASPELVNETQWLCWHRLFRDAAGEISDADLLSCAAGIYKELAEQNRKCVYSFWDPFHAD